MTKILSLQFPQRLASSCFLNIFDSFGLCCIRIRHCQFFPIFIIQLIALSFRFQDYDANDCDNTAIRLGPTLQNWSGRRELNPRPKRWQRVPYTLERCISMFIYSQTIKITLQLRLQCAQILQQNLSMKKLLGILVLGLWLHRSLSQA